MKDTQKERVYEAEQALRWLYDHTKQGDYTVNIGFDLTLPPEAKFGSVESVQSYVNRVTQMPSVVAEFGNRGEVKVRQRKGTRFAHYEPMTNTIAVHDGRNNWAMRELVVLHELAHHFSPGAQHGPRFAANFARLADLVMGPEVGLALRVLFQQNNVATNDVVSVG